MHLPRPAALFSLSPTARVSTTGAQAAVTLGLSAVAGLALVASPDWWIAFGLLGVAALTAFGLINPALFLALFLFIRPILDQFTKATAGVPSANVSGAFGALVVAITIVVLTHNRRRLSAPITTPLLAIALLSIVAAAQARFELGGALGTNSLSELVRLAALIAVFLLAAHVTRGSDRVKALFVVVGLSAVIPAGWGIWEFIVGAPVKEGQEIGRISGPFTGPVPFGAFLSFAALLLIFGPVQRIPAWLRWPAVAMILFALIESYSRVGWVLFILGVAILAWPTQKRVVATFAVGLALLMVVSTDFRTRALPLGSDAPTAESSAGGYESYGWRMANWNGLLDVWSEKPLLGWGLESTRYVNPRAPAEGVGVAGGGYEAHNMIVRVLVEGGVLLLAVYLAFFAAVLSRLWRLSRTAWDLQGGARVLLVIWGLTLFTGATTDDPISLTAVMVGLLGLTGAIEGAWQARTEGASELSERRAKPRVGEPATFWRPAAPDSGVG